jgi:hypothetical protein
MNRNNGKNAIRFKEYKSCFTTLIIMAAMRSGFSEQRKAFTRYHSCWTYRKIWYNMPIIKEITKVRVVVVFNSLITHVFLAANIWWISVPFIPSDATEVVCYSSLVQTSSKAAIFMPCSLGTKALQPNPTCNMSLSDPELQDDQASAVLPIIQHKYSNTAFTSWISLIHFMLYWFKEYAKWPAGGGWQAASYPCTNILIQLLH